MDQSYRSPSSLTRPAVDRDGGSGAVDGDALWGELSLMPGDESLNDQGGTVSWEDTLWRGIERLMHLLPSPAKVADWSRQAAAVTTGSTGKARLAIALSSAFSARSHCHSQTSPSTTPPRAQDLEHSFVLVGAAPSKQPSCVPSLRFHVALLM